MSASVLPDTNVVCLNADFDYGQIKDGAIALEHDSIEWVGHLNALPVRYTESRVTRHDCKGMLLTPGLNPRQRVMQGDIRHAQCHQHTS